MKNKMKQLFGIILSFVLVLGLMPWTSLTAYAVDTDLTMDDLVRAVGDENFSRYDGNVSISIYVDNGVLKLMYFVEGGNGQIHNAEDFGYTSNDGKYHIYFSEWAPTYYLELNSNNYITSFVSDDNNNSYAISGTSENPFEKSVTNYTVTYKVVNGTWSDDSTTDKTETVQSGAKPASVPTGMKAASGYTGGAWDTDPADATITGATTFTYTFNSEADNDGSLIVESADGAPACEAGGLTSDDILAIAEAEGFA